METQIKKDILVINDGNKGHLKQSMALIGIIRRRAEIDGYDPSGITVKVVEAKFKSWSLKAFIKVFNPYLSPRHPLQRLLLPPCMTPESLKEILEQTPDIILSCGAAGSGVSTLLKKKTGARNIVILNPGYITRDDFDLSIVPNHDVWKWLPFKSNVVTTDLALTPITSDGLARLHTGFHATDTGDRGTTIGLLVGGNNRSFRFTGAVTHALAKGVAGLCRKLDAQLCCTTSRRTPRNVDTVLECAFASRPFCRTFVKGREDRDPTTVEKILACSDLVIVSGESISMVSEAVASGKPVVVFMPQKVLPVYTKYERFIGNLVKKKFVTKVDVREIGTIVADRLVRPAVNPSTHDELRIVEQCWPLFARGKD